MEQSEITKSIARREQTLAFTTYLDAKKKLKELSNYDETSKVCVSEETCAGCRNYYECGDFERATCNISSIK